MANIKKQGTLSGTYSSRDKAVRVKLSVVQFDDGGCVVNYCPALDVYGYGANDAEAEASLHLSVEEFFRYTINKKTLSKELESLGWQVKKETKFTPPLFSTLIESNPTLREVYNSKKTVRKIDTGFSIPAIS